MRIFSEKEIAWMIISIIIDESPRNSHHIAKGFANAHLVRACSKLPVKNWAPCMDFIEHLADHASQIKKLNGLSWFNFRVFE